MLSIIPAGSIQPAPNCEPFEISLTFQGQPTQYWILRGELPAAFAVLHDHEFIALRAQFDEGTLEQDWESISARVLASRTAAEIPAL